MWLWWTIACATSGQVDEDTGTSGQDSAPPADSQDSAGDSAGDTGDSADTADTADEVDPPRGDPDLVCQAALRCDDTIPDEPKIVCDLTLVSGDGEPVYEGEAMLEKRGRSSVSFPKPPYSLELHDDADELVPAHGTWTWLDGRSPPPEGWTAPGFDDEAWTLGRAPLGYGDSPSTTLDYGEDPADKPPAAWMRSAFLVEDPTQYVELSLRLQRDDGAIVWLNGVEVVRSNMAADATAASWAASTSSDEWEKMWYLYELDPALLVEGRNVLAVEVHQASASSSDLALDAQLLGSTGRATPNLFGMGGEDDWMLQSAYIDRLLWRNKLAYDLFQSWGGPERWAAQQVYCELERNGQYEGLYLLGELPRRDDDRLPLQDDGGVGGSFIVKLDDQGGFRASNVSYGEWQAVWPPQDERHAEGLAAIDARLSEWESLLVAGDEAQWEVFDLDSAVDWVILEELFKNNDAYFLSVHLWQDVGGRLHVIPWDFDLTLGYPYYDCGATGWLGRQAFVEAWAASPAFQARFAARWAELRAGPLTDEALVDHIAALEALMGEARVRNFERWPVADIAFSWGGVENWLCPADSWEAEHSRVLEWLPARTAWMDANAASFGG